MKKILYLLLIFSLIGAYPFNVDALSRPPVLEVTGIFVAMDDTQQPSYIVLKVGSEEASGPLFPSCLFYDDKGRSVGKDYFVKSYLKRMITLEIIEGTGEVFSCRLGS